LLSEELSRCGVELIFLKAPAGATPEDGSEPGRRASGAFRTDRPRWD
jgi:hypothetical protein